LKEDEKQKKAPELKVRRKKAARKIYKR